MYTLYAYPNSYAMTVHALMEELGLDYTVKWVGIFTATPDPDFVAASPHARVPALETPDGPVFETGAIALYLAEKHASGAYQIQTGDPRRARFLQWFHYLASTLQPDVMIQFHPEVYFEDDATQQRFLKASRKRLGSVLDTIADAIGDGPYFFGDTVTVLDFLLALQTVWPEVHPNGIAARPAIERHLTAMMARPAVARIHALHMAHSKPPIQARSDPAG